MTPLRRAIIITIAAGAIAALIAATLLPCRSIYVPRDSITMLPIASLQLTDTHIIGLLTRTNLWGRPITASLDYPTGATLSGPVDRAGLAHGRWTFTHPESTDYDTHYCHGVDCP